MRNTTSTTSSGRTSTHRLLLLLFFFFKTVPTLIAAGSIYLGYRLFILGVTGKASLSVDTGTVSGQLVNAAPGLFFAVGGLVALIVIVWRGVHIDIPYSNSDDQVGRVDGVDGVEFRGGTRVAGVRIGKIGGTDDE